MAADAVGVDQTQYLGLAFGGDGGKAAAAGNPGILIACELQKVFLYPAVRQIVDRAAIDRGEAVKVRAPVVRNTGRIFERRLLKILDDMRICAVVGRRTA